MDVEVTKCNVVAISRGQLGTVDDIPLPSSEMIQHLSPVYAYKYLSILESDSFMHI